MQRVRNLQFRKLPGDPLSGVSHEFAIGRDDLLHDRRRCRRDHGSRRWRAPGMYDCQFHLSPDRLSCRELQGPVARTVIGQPTTTRPVDAVHPAGTTMVVQPAHPATLRGSVPLIMPASADGLFEPITSRSERRDAATISS